MIDDLISRQSAKLKVARVIWEDGDSSNDFQDKCVDCLDDVPSAARKKGRWDVEHGVFMNDGIYGDLYHCSVCGYRERNPEGFNYCPNCGAKMEVTEGI